MSIFLDMAVPNARHMTLISLGCNWEHQYLVYH